MFFSTSCFELFTMQRTFQNSLQISVFSAVSSHFADFILVIYHHSVWKTTIAFICLKTINANRSSKDHLQPNDADCILENSFDFYSTRSKNSPAVRKHYVYSFVFYCLKRLAVVTFYINKHLQTFLITSGKVGWC